MQNIKKKLQRANRIGNMAEKNTEIYVHGIMLPAALYGSDTWSLPSSKEYKLHISVEDSSRGNICT